MWLAEAEKKEALEITLRGLCASYNHFHNHFAQDASVLPRRIKRSIWPATSWCKDGKTWLYVFMVRVILLCPSRSCTCPGYFAHPTTNHAESISAPVLLGPFRLSVYPLS